MGVCYSPRSVPEGTTAVALAAASAAWLNFRNTHAHTQSTSLDKRQPHTKPSSFVFCVCFVPAPTCAPSLRTHTHTHLLITIKPSFGCSPLLFLSTRSRSRLHVSKCLYISGIFFYSPRPCMDDQTGLRSGRRLILPLHPPVYFILFFWQTKWKWNWAELRAVWIDFLFCRVVVDCVWFDCSF